MLYMPVNSGLSFVVIQHLSPDYKSLMADILGKNTEMMVLQAENGMVVEPNTVYLIPPKNNMTIQDGKLILTQFVQGMLNHPIDVFFTSLAKEQRERAIAVIFSGTGSDGTNGIKSVKENGGLVVVQDPSTAKFDGMPKSAINTGLVDFVLSPREVVDEILNFSNYPSIIQPNTDEEFFSDEETFTKIYGILKKISGIDFTYYKRTTVMRRIERRMVVTHSSNLVQYAKMLTEDSGEAEILVKEILIGVTNFFRDPVFFEKLKSQVISTIVKRTEDKEPIRVWSAGCSTGEEAYSIAILFQEVMEELNVQRDVKIFATDVDAKAIEQAGKGIFAESIMDDVSMERLSKYFLKRNDQYAISKEIRRMIIFAPHNMLSDPPFGKLDLICCRNVMIYFQPVLQRGLFAIFHSALKNNGYLFLGKSETASEYAAVFKPVCAQEKIYIHKGEGKLEDLTPPAFNIPNIQTVAPKTSGIGNREQNEYVLEGIYTRFLENFLPASVILNEKNDAIHFFGNYQDYLSLASGRATLNFFSIVNQDLSLVASTAINRCRSENISVTYTGVAVDCPGGRRNIDLVVCPVPDGAVRKAVWWQFFSMKNRRFRQRVSQKSTMWILLLPEGLRIWNRNSRNRKTI